MTFEVDILFGICGFFVNGCDNWPFSFLMRMSKNGSSLKLCSMENLILGCRFCCMLRKSLISPL